MTLVSACCCLGLQLQNKLSEARSTLQNSVDPTTGQRLFHPATGRAPRHMRNTTQQPVSEYLYSLSHQQEEKFKAAAMERERRAREEATSSKQAQGSKQLVRALQHKRFKQVRRMLTACAAGVTRTFPSSFQRVCRPPTGRGLSAAHMYWLSQMTPCSWYSYGKEEGKSAHIRANRT